MSQYTPAPSPHTHAAMNVGRIMFTVWLALLPASLYAVYLFGWPVLNLFLITVATALLAEAATLWLAGKDVRSGISDGSGLLTAWLLAMTLPPWAPWWIATVGAVFAVVVGKQVFGGIGQNLFNPAMLGRVALLIAFPLEMTSWVSPQPLFTEGAPGFLDGLAVTFAGMPNIDAVSGATVLGHMKTEIGRGVPLSEVLPGIFTLQQSATGQIRGSLGETSALLILIGGIFLLLRHLITWHIPFAMLASVAVLATLMHWVDPARYADASVHLLSGGLMLGAFFIATDPVGSPSTPRGQFIFGAACGALVYIIRTWAGFPEGVAFAVLLMNAATPLIDHYFRPRIYGRHHNGEPLDYTQGTLARRLTRYEGRKP